MTRAASLAAVSILAFCAGCVFAAELPVPKGARELYTQNSNDAGDSINSQNYTSDFSSDNNQAADDFVIPKGKKWRVTEIDVSGAYFNGSGPATSENVIFYRDKHGEPGVPVRGGAFNNLIGTDHSASFDIRLPGGGLDLEAGKYWVSVVANMDFGTSGEWGWDVNGAQHGKQAMWQNPGGGFYICPTWGTIENCQASPGPDLMFDIRGKGDK